LDVTRKDSSRARRVGVAARLLVLVMLPMVAFGTLAVDSVLRNHASADVASRIARDVTTTRKMVQLSRSLANEAIAVGLENAALADHVSVAYIAGVIGYGPDMQIAQTRRATNAALSSLGKMSPVPAGQIDALRRQVDAQGIGSTEAVAAYVALYGRINCRGSTRVDRLSGSGPSRSERGSQLAVALSELQAVITAVQYGDAQSADLNQIVFGSATSGALRHSCSSGATARYVRLCRGRARGVTR
jgi:hypothetical protein